MANLEQMQQAWEEYAEAYDKAITPISTRVGEEAVRAAGVGPGMRLLDIAAGGGALSIPAARGGADVIAVDYSRAMVGLLQRKARDMGISNLEVRFMDGTALELETATFDVACSALGIMLFPDRAKGLREMARVVKPGGKGVMVVFAAPQRVLFISLFFQAMAQAIPGFAPPQNSPLFCLQDMEQLRREMTDAGFSDVQVQQFETDLEVESADHWWNMLVSGAPAIAGLLRGLPEERQRAIRSALQQIVAARSDGRTPVKLPLAFNIAVAAK